MIFNQRYFKITLALFLLVGGGHAYYRLTDDFRVGNLVHSGPLHPEWEVGELSSFEQGQINYILDQPYTYLGKGAQSYAFLSRDKQYVIKFFKAKHLRMSWYEELLPPIGMLASLKEEIRDKREGKLLNLFSGYKLAFDKHRNESGLIYIHLTQTGYLNRQITVVDKLGLRHYIELDPILFVIQKKGETTRQTLSNLLDSGKVQLAKEKVRQIVDLYLSEYAKGIYDRDHGVLRNTGFIGKTPFHLDLGKMSQDEKIRKVEYFKKDFQKVVEKFQAWFEQNYPELSSELVEDMEGKLREVYRKRAFAAST